MRKKENENIKRVALYIRVSGEEQKISGLSLEAQQERLEKYAKEKGWIIAGTYIDAAKTARKNMHKRAEFQNMIEAVKRDEIDLLLFCRLDRWFRSVADYYKVMEILEQHNCEWLTTDEEYDTTTANGRLYINVKLSIAQNEADIDGERIDVVFDSKISRGTVVSGKCLFGYKINSEKRLEIDEEKAAIVQDAFDYYEKNVTQRGTITYIRQKYGVNWCDATFRRMLKEELYSGVYNRNNRFNENFCEPIISKKQFQRVQELRKRNSRKTKTGNVYIFTSTLVCDECGHKLIGYAICRDGLKHAYYRCNQHFQRKLCNNNRSINEDTIEKWLFDNLENEIKKVETAWSVSAAKKKRNSVAKDKAAIKSKLSKLKDLYVNDLIDIEEYKKDYEIYTAALNELPENNVETPPNFSKVRRLLDKDFKEIYNNLTREEKRTLWRSVIKEIRINSDREVVSIFLGSVLPFLHYPLVHLL
ncbi:MAG: recombinase family protein [Lachnospiraceae bacterium]|nr:recombinase family protein [Lachnospiraceae bacterium]